MIATFAAFADYFHSVRQRTIRYIDAVPDTMLAWAPALSEMTLGDLMRHISAAEAMFVHLVVSGTWRYADHHSMPAITKAEILATMDSTHAAALEQLRQLDASVLQEQRPSLQPDGPTIKVWRWLMAMTEHEIHHRSQIASYLSQMGIQPPQIYGMTVEEVIALATG